jgi:antirestriction protein ArdC
MAASITEDHKPSTADKVKALLQQAEAGAQDVFTSDRYLHYLRAMSQFHHYSARNVLLILLQNPDATQVAGYTTWQRNFHRQVKHGEKGLVILGYTPIKRQVDVPQKDSLGNLVMNSDGTLATQRQTKVIPSFKPMYVFDVSQTDGEPLPQLVTTLSTSVERYQEFVETLISLSSCPVSFEDVPHGAHGYFSPAEQKIVVQKDMSESQTIKTLVHEIAHSRMHNENEPNLTYNREEVEAESMAFVVCNHLGIDTSDYSFPYIATWASGKEVKELQASLDRIQKAATTFIDQIDEAMDNAPEQIRDTLVSDLSAQRIGASPSSASPTELQQRITDACAAAANRNAIAPKPPALRDRGEEFALN